jgi:hypothetical protein
VVGTLRLRRARGARKSGAATPDAAAERVDELVG